VLTVSNICDIIEKLFNILLNEMPGGWTREMLFERKALIDILTLKPDRLIIRKEEPLHGSILTGQ